VREKERGKRIKMDRYCSRLCYLFFFVVLIALQGLMIYLQSNSIRQTKKHIPFVLGDCVNKTNARSKQQRVTSNCVENEISRNKNMAFVFYITKSKPEYECYLYVNLHILQVVYPRLCEVDFVILHEQGYKFRDELKLFRRVRLFPVKQRRLKMSNFDKYYADCFLKLESFRLYTHYDRIVFTDVDGIFFTNPYSLLTQDLAPYQVGASYCNWFFPKKWLTSSIFIAELSEQLYEKFAHALSKNLKDLYRNKQSVLDMEVFNWVLGEGKHVKIYNNLFNMDSHYIDKEHIENFYNESNVPFFIHFSHVKPHLYRRYSSCLDERREQAKPEFFRAHREFWMYYYMYC